MNDVECGMSRDRDGNFLLFGGEFGLFLLYSYGGLWISFTIPPIFLCVLAFVASLGCFFRLLFFSWFKFLYAKW
ncbi:hypothetical protein FPQ18DRAFT_7711 [Pyronema domesticum]|nr:hypothetical protein FPQ18DRAFT_7711 [Pyronema domesticum]